MKFQFCLAKPEEGGVALDDSSTKHSGRYLQILVYNYKVFSSILNTKGQLISKRLFGVFNVFQKTKKKQVDLRYHSSKVEFVRFLEETWA